MFNINSIFSVLSLSPQTQDIMSLFSDLKNNNKHQQSKKMTNTKQTKKANQQKKSKKDAEQKAKSTTNKKDVCQQDCICDDILNKKHNSNQKNSQYILSNMTNEELKKYILFSDVLGTPVCKKRRMY